MTQTGADGRTLTKGRSSQEKCRGPENAVQEEGPDVLSNIRAYKSWQQPTLTRPYVSLPSAAEDFTAVFGMGTGGTPRLWSPEIGIPTRGREKFQFRIIEIVGETNARKNLLHSNLSGH